MNVTLSFTKLSPPTPGRLTICEALATKLGREPTSAELKADVERILEDSLVERAAAGQLTHQRRSA